MHETFLSFSKSVYYLDENGISAGQAGWLVAGGSNTGHYKRNNMFQQHSLLAKLASVQYYYVTILALHMCNSSLLINTQTIYSGHMLHVVVTQTQMSIDHAQCCDLKPTSGSGTVLTLLVAFMHRL